MSTGSDTDRALAFLAGRQRASGQFVVLLGTDLEDRSVPFSRDSTPFATALIAHSLGFSDAPLARAMIDRALTFLQAQMEPGGVWRYWTAGHHQRDTIPPDLDDTACVAQVLRAHGISVPDHRALLLANRDARGLFYTWITPRLRPPIPRHAGLWRIALGRYRHPLKNVAFWQRTQSGRYDVDAVVNANVLFALGEGPDTKPVVDYLAGIIRRGEEDRSDKWHRSAFTFHYMVARCFAGGATGLGSVRDEAVARITAHANPDGSIGTSALDTALAACALRSWDAGADTAARAAASLRASQRPDGSWPIVPMYWGGPDRFTGWGSEELTTGYCLEALLRCPAT